MKIKDRVALTSDTVSRVINSAAISEILRVYSMSVQRELDALSDEDFISSLESAGYLDLLEKHTTGEVFDSRVEVDGFSLEKGIY